MACMILFDIVAKILKDSSRTTVRSCIKEGRVTVRGRVIKDAQFPISDAAGVKLWPKTQMIGKEVELLYADPYFVVVSKPAGLLSVEAHYERENTLHSLLKKYFRPGRIFVVHRLDREVSGVILFARTEEALLQIKNILKEKKVEREYLAIVEGCLEKDRGTWQSFLVEGEDYKVHSADRGEKAVTHFEVMQRSKRFTGLRLFLETGRKNQIRVHTSESGHPIVGDKKYGAKANPVKRLCLHASRLSFVHPFKQKKMQFETKIPEEFFAVWEK